MKAFRSLRHRPDARLAENEEPEFPAVSARCSMTADRSRLVPAGPFSIRTDCFSFTLALTGERSLNTGRCEMRFLTALAFCLFIAGSALGQSMSDAEQELLRIRAKMSQDFVDAVATKDVSLVAEHYTKDAVI